MRTGLQQTHRHLEYPERAKTVNARRRPEVSVLVLSDDLGDAWVQVDGTAQVLDMP